MKLSRLLSLVLCLCIACSCDVCSAVAEGEPMDFDLSDEDLSSPLFEFTMTNFRNRVDYVAKQLCGTEFEEPFSEPDHEKLALSQEDYYMYAVYKGLDVSVWGDKDKNIILFSSNADVAFDDSDSLNELLDKEKELFKIIAVTIYTTLHVRVPEEFLTGLDAECERVFEHIDLKKHSIDEILEGFYRSAVLDNFELSTFVCAMEDGGEINLFCSIVRADNLVEDVSE